MTVPSLRPLSFGEVLDGTFTLYRRNFFVFVGTLLLMALLLGVAGVVLLFTGGALAAVLPLPLTVSVVILLLVAFLALALVPCGAITWQAAQSYTGQPVSVREGLAAGGRRALTLLAAVFLAYIVCSIMTFAAAMGVGLVGVLMESMGPAVGLVGSMVVGLGLIAGIFFIMAFFFGVLPAVMVEEKGPGEALSRSFELAKGAVQRIAGLLFVTMVIAYLPLVAVGALTGIVTEVTAATRMTALPDMRLVVAQLLLMCLVALLTAPFLLSLFVVMYYDRRVRVEGLDVEMLTDQLRLAGA